MTLFKTWKQWKTWQNIKSEYNNNKYKISAPTWNYTFDLPDESYSFSDIQDHFEFIFKKYETLTKNPLIQIYPNKTKNSIVFKIKTGCKLELLTPWNNVDKDKDKDVDKDNDIENVAKLESLEVVLVYCNLVKNDYQQTPKVLFLFTFFFNDDWTQLILNFLLLKFGLETKLLKNLRLKIWH